MKKTIFMLLFMFATTALAVEDKLALAIAKVESGCDDRAVGDNGKAIGRYQIHAAPVADYNKANKASFKHSDMRDPVKARRVLDWYLGHYGRNKDAVAKARIWNGGPSGHKKSATLAYGAKVRALL